MQFISENLEAICALLVTLYALVCGIVALTPTKVDDDALRRFMQRVSFLAPRDIGGLSMPGKMPRERNEDAIGPMILVLLCIAPLLGACGGSGLDVTRQAAAGGALAVVSVDPILAAEYDRAVVELEAGEVSEEAFTLRLQKLDRAERALRSLSSSLTAVDLALGAYEDGRECGLRSALDGAAAAAQQVIAALDAAGVDVPPLVSQALGIAALFVDSPVCEPESAAVAQ